MNKSVLLLLLIFIGILALWLVYRHNFKKIVVSCVCFITGGPKTGKTLLASTLSQADYKHRYCVWRVQKFFGGKSFNKEMPLFYTNGFITFGKSKNGVVTRKSKLDDNIRYLTTDDLLRMKRFAYGSVIFVQEASLLADNMDYKNDVRNVDLSLFNKLIGHETKGGAIYYDSQSSLDVHYSIKRVAANYLFIQKNKNFLLFRILYVREMISKDIGENDFNEDIDLTMRKVFIPFWRYHKYNRYEYSYLTDDLEVSNKIKYDEDKKLISFNPLYIERSDKRSKVEEKKEEINK